MLLEVHNVTEEAYQERNRTHDEVRYQGAIGNLNEGIEITTHNVSTRLIAWPGNGFQTESVHVLTLKPGDETQLYRYDLSEDAYLCLRGTGEIFLRGQWITIEAGDLAFFPRGIEHGARNTSSKDFVLVNSISTPPFDLYESAGFYDKAKGVMKLDVIEEAKKAAQPGNLTTDYEIHFSESNPEVRSWNLGVHDIVQNGALFNVYKGASTGVLAMPMVFLLWPGYGINSVGFHYGSTGPNVRSLVHKHPVSDECLIRFGGTGQFYCGDKWVDIGPLDCVLAPCGVLHSAAGSENADKEQSFVGGFASPPQLDLYVRSPYYQDGKFTQPEYVMLK